MGKVWKLQEARDHFSELVRRAETDGPQAITVHGREKAVVLSSSEYHRICRQRSGDSALRTGRDLLEFFQNSPLRGVDLEIERFAEPLRDPIDLDE